MNAVTQQMLDDFTRRAAYKWAKDYKLIDRDFAICYWPSKKFDYVIKSGGVIRVYFTHTPKYTEYEPMMRRCLEQVALLKRTKRVAIVVQSQQQELDAEFRKEFGHFEQIARLLPYEELTFETNYKVTMTHRGTGLTVVKEGHIGKYGKTIPRLMIDARNDLSDLVDALLKSREQVTLHKVMGQEGTPEQLEKSVELLKSYNFGESETER